jgi:hypothetical protein
MDDAMSQLADIFLQPARVFAEQRERPTFVVPLLIFTALTVAFTLAYFMRVDPAWYADHMLDNTGRELSAQDMAQMKAAMPGARVMGWIGAVTSAIAVVLVTLITALYVWIAGKVTGTPLGYRHGLSLSAWSSMPMVLGLLVALAGALMMSPQTAIESLMLTNVDPLLVDLPAEHRWNRLAQGFNLLTLWAVWLFALGWRAWTRSSWLQAWVVALIPTLVVFGVIALIP